MADIGFSPVRGTLAVVNATSIVDGQVLFTDDQGANNKIFMDTGTKRVQVGGTLTVDTTLSTSSNNPIANSAVATAINTINSKIGVTNFSNVAPTLSSGMRKMDIILNGTFTAAGWTTTTLNSVTVYTQTATVTGCTTTTQLSDPKFYSTNNLTTNATLQKALNLINIGYTVANSGTVTCYVATAPTSNITVYWYGKETA